MPFALDLFMERIREAYATWEAPAITLIAQGGATPFEVLVSTVLSLRTRDRVTYEASRRLFARARTPEAILALTADAIEALIRPVSFSPTKARRLREISERILTVFRGEVPGEMDALLSLPGVGRKTANLVLVEGLGKPGICVDTHVHRISNRLGYVKTKNADKTELALREKLPREYWVEYPEILVTFGQLLCRPVSPLCSRCPVSDLCPKIGVEKHR